MRELPSRPPALRPARRSVRPPTRPQSSPNVHGIRPDDARARLSRMPTLFRFTTPDEKRPDLRVSQNGRIVLDGKKNLYADAKTIETCSEVLAKVVADKGAYLRLEAAGAAPKEYPGLVKVVPKWVGRGGRLPSLMKDLDALNKSSDVYLSHADCHMTAQTIMGSTDEPSSVANYELGVVGGLDPLDDSALAKLKPIPKPDTESGKMSDHGGNRVLDRFLMTALPVFAGRLEDALKSRPKDHEEASALPDIFKTTAEGIRAGVIEGAGNAVDTVKKLRLEYRKIIANRQLAHMFGAIFKVNEFIEPKIGQALAQFNDEAQKKAEDIAGIKREDEIERRRLAGEAPAVDTLPREGRDLWNFHWAGVIMKDGGDYVTLENLSVELTSVKNELWYFAMYGPGEQSFHTQASKDSHVGNYPLTLLFESSK